MRTRALMYHDVVQRGRAPGGFGGAGPMRYAVAWDRFEEHLDLISATVGRPPFVIDETAPRDAAGGWILTFDDGGAGSIDVGTELARRGWRGYFFVTSGLVGTTGFLEPDEVSELDRMGHVVGSHSVTHPDRMGALSPAEIRREWSESVAMLSDVLGRRVRAASVPGGYYHRRVAEAAASEGITTLFNSEPVQRARFVGGCVVAGRYAIRADTAAAEAAEAAAGHPRRWGRQYVAWNVRKPVKIVGGERYDRARRAVLARRSSRDAS